MTAASAWAAAASETVWVCRATVRTAPSRVCLTTPARASASAASDSSQPRMSATSAGASSPSSSTSASRTVKSGESLRPRLASIRARWVDTVSTASTGVRSRTTATAAERSAALRRKSHGTWSAYRAAEVTKSHMSAAARSCAASVRLRSSTESMSGASRIASPAGHGVGGHQLEGRRVVGRWVTRSRSGSSRSWPNHSASAGLCTSTGERVVGRSTPGSLTFRPTSEFTSVDLPAPVEPPTTVSSGASIVISRGRT